MMNRARNDAVTTGNVINVAGDMIKRECVLQSETTLTPGCMVVPYSGTTVTTGFDGSTGNVEAPSAASTLPIAVLDLSSVDGMSLVGEYNQGDQVPVLYPTKGCIVRVRIASDAMVEENGFLTITADGTGFAAAGAAANAVGIAREATPTGDVDLPTFIKMEVL